MLAERLIDTLPHKFNFPLRVDAMAMTTPRKSECKVVTRRKDSSVESSPSDSRIVVLNTMVLEPYFKLPLHEAAKALGVCETALKKVCRKIGLKSWPYRQLKAIDRKISTYSPDALKQSNDAFDITMLSQLQRLREKRDSLIFGFDSPHIFTNTVGENSYASPYPNDLAIFDARSDAPPDYQWLSPDCSTELHAKTSYSMNPPELQLPPQWGPPQHRHSYSLHWTPQDCAIHVRTNPVREQEPRDTFRAFSPHDSHPAHPATLHRNDPRSFPVNQNLSQVGSAKPPCGAQEGPRWPSHVPFDSRAEMTTRCWGGASSHADTSSPATFGRRDSHVFHCEAIAGQSNKAARHHPDDCALTGQGAHAFDSAASAFEYAAEAPGTTATVLYSEAVGRRADGHTDRAYGEATEHAVLDGGVDILDEAPSSAYQECGRVADVVVTEDIGDAIGRADPAAAVDGLAMAAAAHDFDIGKAAVQMDVTADSPTSSTWCSASTDPFHDDWSFW